MSVVESTKKKRNCSTCQFVKKEDGKEVCGNPNNCSSGRTDFARNSDDECSEYLVNEKFTMF